MELNYDREIELMEAIPAMVCLADVLNDTLLYLNAVGRSIIGEDYKGQKPSDVFGKDSRVLTRIAAVDNQKAEPPTYGQLVNGKWMLLSSARVFKEGFENTVLITGNDVTELKREGYFDAVSNKDPETGIYNKQSGIHFLENYLYGLKGNGDHFTIAYIRIEIDREKDDAEKQAVKLNFIEILKTAIRGTDIIASMDGLDFIIIFPKCTFEIVDNIMTTIDNKLELMNHTETVTYDYGINHSILELDKSNTYDRDAILNKMQSALL